MTNNSLFCDFYWDETHGTVQPRWHHAPISVVVFLVVQIHHVDFVELAPCHTLAVEPCNTVGGKVADFHLDGVASRMKVLSNTGAERHGEEGGHFLTVDVDSRALTDVAKVKHPVIGVRGR